MGRLPGATDPGDIGPVSQYMCTHIRPSTRSSHGLQSTWHAKQYVFRDSANLFGSVRISKYFLTHAPNEFFNDGARAKAGGSTVRDEVVSLFGRER